MIRGVACVSLLLTGYAWLILALGGGTALALMLAPHLAVLYGKHDDPLGALMFALYAAVQCVILAALCVPVTWLVAGRELVAPVVLLVCIANTMREVYRYLAIDHFHPRSMRFGLACGCLAYCLLAGAALL
ncbi:hypothetical protein HS125_15145 [bacterium]|nr:hypothetical protein [bacterium]